MRKLINEMAGSEDYTISRQLELDKRHKLSQIIGKPNRFRL